MSHILIADDYEQNRYLLRVLLEDKGHRVTITSNGSEALKLARLDPPELIMSDILMPVMDGFDLCREWRRDPILRSIPFIFYTATYTDPKDKKLALNLGADLFIIKTQEPQILMKHVDELLAAQAGKRLKINNPVVEDTGIMREYNERLVHKLEHKISRLELAQKQLEKARQQITEIFERITDAFVALDNNWRYTYMNKKAGEIANRDPKKMIGKHVWTEYPESVGQPFHLAYEKAMATQQYVYLEEYYPPFDRWFENHIYPSPDGLSIFFRDITEKKKAEEKLAQSEKRFRALVENNEGIISLVDEKLNVLFRSSSATRITGWSNEEMEIKNAAEYIHPDDLERIQTTIASAVASPEKIFSFSIQVKHKKGHYIWLEGTIKNMLHDPAVGGIITNMQDITERKKAEEEIVYQANLLARVNDAVIATDENFVLTSWNRAAERIYGWTAKEVIGKAASEILQTEFITISRAEAIKQLKESGKYFSEVINYRKDGSKIFVGTQANALQDAGGKTIGYVSINRDITERKKTEEEISRTRQNYADLINTIDGIVWEADAKTFEFKFVSKQSERLLGYPAEKWLSEPSFWANHIHPEDRNWTVNYCMQSTKNKIPHEFEYRFIAADGHIVWLRDIVTVITEDDEPVLLRGIMVDITERKKAEQEIKISEEKYRTLFEQMDEGFCIIEMIYDDNGMAIDYRFLEINPAFVRQTGLTNALNKTIREMVPEHEAYWFEIYGSVARTGKPVRFENAARALGKYYDVFAFRTGEDGSSKVGAFFYDITERKYAEEDLIKSEELFSGAFHASPAGVIITRIADGKIIDANETFLTMFEYSREEAIGHTSIELNMFSPDGRAKLIEKQLESGGLTNFELLSQTKSGKPINLFFSSKQLMVNDELCHITTLIDITERKKAEQALKESEEKFRTLVQQAADAIFIVDQEGNYLDANDSASLITGYSIDELKKMNGRDIVESEDLKKNPLKTEEIKSGQTIYVERIIKRKDKTLLDVDIKARMMENGKVIVILRDITERKKAEILLRNEKDRFEKIVNTVPGVVCSFKLNPDGSSCYPYSSPGMFDMFGINPEELTEDSSPLLKKIHTDDIENVQKAIFASAQKMTEFRIECRFEHPQKGWIWFETTSLPSANPDGSIVWTGFASDITERKKAEEKITQSEELFSSAFHSSPTGMLISQISDGKIIDANDSFHKTFEFSREDTIGHSVIELKLITPEERAKFVQKQIEYSELNNYELLSQSKSGRPVHLLFSTKKVRIKDEPCYLTTVIDITERKIAEKEIENTAEQLRQLTAHLQTIRDEERKRISREIHDELGQQLTAIKMDVAWIDKKIPDPSAGTGNTSTIKNKLKNINTLLDGSNRAVRKILSELRPAGLENHALTEALEWQGRQFTETTGIPVTYTPSGKIIQLPEQVATCIFRVYQESLTNIMRHAKADKVLASLKFTDDSVVLTIKDDGKGFDIKSATSKKSFGILGMKERVHSLNGKFELVSAKGKGTKIVVSLPYK